MKRRILGVFLCFAILINLFSELTPVMAGASAFDDIWHWANPQPQGNDLKAVAYGGGRYAAVGKSGTVLTSTDNVAWVRASSDFDSDYNTVAYGNGLFVAGGNGGYVGKSADGVNWTYDSSDASDDILGIAFGNSIFVAVGDGYIMISSDGDTWTPGSDPDISGKFNGVAYADGYFIAVGDSGRILYSSDGLDWEVGSNGDTADLYSVTYGTNGFVAVGQNGTILTAATPDAAWTKNGTIYFGVDDVTTIFDSYLYSAAYGNGVYVIASENMYLTSSDGTTWTVTFDEDGLAALYGVIYGGGGFAAVGAGGLIIGTDGISSWIKRSSGSKSYLAGMTYDNSLFVAVGTNEIMTSLNGVQWTRRAVPGDAGTLEAVAGNSSGSYAAVGYGYDSELNYIGTLVYSTDGTTWQKASTVLGTNMMLKGVAYGNGQYVAVGSSWSSGTIGVIYTSADGSNWSQITTGPIGRLTDVTYGNGMFAAVGEGDTLMTSADGTSWTTRSRTKTINIGSISYTGITYGEGLFIAVGGTGEIVKSSDGAAWDDMENYSGSLSCITYGSGYFVTAGQSGLILRCAVSGGVADTWERTGQYMTTNRLNAAAYGNGVYAVAGDSGTILYSGSVPVPTTANVTNNTVSVSPTGITAGSSTTITAAGDRQSAAGSVSGDERYIPTTWTSTETGMSGTFAEFGGVYTSNYTASAAGSYTVTATFQKQTWSGSTWNDVSGSTDTKTTTLTVTAAPTTANASNNTVSVSPTGITAGSSTTITAAGDRQSAAGSVSGDERYIPTTWTSTETGMSGTFAESGGVYTSSYTPSAAGSYTVTATFQKQTWNGSTWNDVSGSTDTKTTSLTVTAAPVPTTANTADNSVSVNPASVTVGGSTTITAAGDKQNAAGAVIGDERYVPTTWTSTEAGKNGTFTVTGSVYTSEYTPSSSGNYTITVTFQKQIWDGSVWNNVSGSTDTKTASLTVTTAPAPTMANAASNIVSVNPTSVTVGSSTTITAAGDRQGATGSVTGEERYIPAVWTSTEAGKNGTFTTVGGIYISDYTPSAAGSYTITATFQKQTWDGSAWNDVSGSTDTKTASLTVTTAPAPTMANAASNIVSVNPTSVTVGSSTTITAAGDRQSAAGAVIGDERYVPTTWASTEAGKNGAFTVTGSVYASDYTPSAAGSYTITTTFQKQTWDGSVWNNAVGAADTKTTALTVNRSGRGGGGSGGNSGTGNTTTAGTTQTGLGNVTIENGSAVVTIDSEKLAKEISGGKPGSIIILAITGNVNKADFNLTVADLKAIADNGSMLQLESSLGIYKLPATEIDFNAILKQYPNISDKNIKVTVRFSIADGSNVILNGSKLVGQSISITVSLVAGDKAIELDEFTKYVERDLPVPDGSRFTTGVVIEKDGTLRPVPTKTITINGKKYAAISSRTNSIYALTIKSVSFDDMKGHWARESVNDLASRLVISGIGNNAFAPDRDITRAEFAAVIVRALGLKAQADPAFTDVMPGSWYYGAVAAAYKYGIVSGYGDGTFRPENKITRQEAMAMTACAMNIAGMDEAITDEATAAELAKFIDGKNFSAWARQPAAAVIRSGLVVGSEGYARPEKNITRAETAVIIRRLLEKAGLI